MKIPWQYSRQVFTAFGLLIVVYIVIFWMLWGIQRLGAITFTTEIKGDILPLLASLPFVAFYVVVFLAATAGFARGAIMAKELPFNKILQAELKMRTMERATIMTKIRSGATVTPDTSYSRALDAAMSARLPILAVLGEDKKVEGVVTSHDIIRKMQEELGKEDDKEPLDARLAKLRVQDLAPRSPVVVTDSEKFNNVLEKMTNNHFTRLIVVKDEETKAYAGAVDVLDVASEILEGTDEA
jgi:CBS domain-containing protein